MTPRRVDVGHEDCVDNEPTSLFKALEAAGWLWTDTRLYAPNRTFWIEGTKGQSTPVEMLLQMSERIKTSLASLQANKLDHLTSTQHQEFVDDMKCLVSAIEELLQRRRQQVEE